MNELTEVNFHVFQKDISKILLHLMAYTNGVWIQMTPANLKDDFRVDVNIEWLEKQCRLLWEYCDYFKNFTDEIPLPYIYLWEVAHSMKPFAGNLNTFISIYKEHNNKEAKDRTFDGIKEMIKIMVKDLWKHIEQISHIKFIDKLIFKPSIFSPDKSICNIIASQESEIEKKNITIKNMIPKDYVLYSYKEIFEIVVHNLISNAVKFSQQEGVITIDFSEEDNNRTRFFIKDTWIWIPENVDVFKNGYTTPSQEWQQWTWLGLNQSKVFLDITWWWISHKKNIPSWTIFSFVMRKKSSISK